MFANKCTLVTHPTHNTKPYHRPALEHMLSKMGFHDKIFAVVVWKRSAIDAQVSPGCMV